MPAGGHFSASNIYSGLSKYLLFGWLYPLVVGWMLTTTVNGQITGESAGYPPLKIINVEQGLPQAFVSGVAEDDDGFIWVSTLGGLARYDGRQILPIYHQSTNPTSPRNNTIVALEKGRKNELWLAYENGEFSRMNTKTGRCQHFPQLTKALLRQGQPTRGLHVDRRGDLWGIMLNHGLFHFNVRSNQITQYSQSASGYVWAGRSRFGLISDTVSAITEDRRGRIWVVTPIGLSQLSSDTIPIRSVRFPNPPTELELMAIRDERVRAFVRPSGEIIVNTRTALLFINPDRATIRSVTFAPQPTIDEPVLYQHTDGTAYLVAGGTFFSFTDKQKLSALWHYTPPSEASLSEFLPTSLCVDQSGVLWVGANTKGLFRVDLAAPPLYAYRYRTVFCTDAFRVGLGISLNAFFRWPLESVKMPSSYIFRPAYDRRGRLWLGIGSEVGYYSFLTGQFTRLPPLNTSPYRDYTDGILRGISVDNNDQVWVVSNAGTPMLFDTNTRQWQAPFGQMFLKSNNLLADSSALWVTTGANGLLRFDKVTHRHRFIHFKPHHTSEADEQLLDIFQDPNHPDWLWISGYQGLIWFNKRTGRYRRFTTAQGLPNNTVYTILGDRQGYLWLSTNRGLCRFHPVTHAVTNFGLSDGLPGEEFNRFHRLALPDGRLAFGGVDGWVMFDPAQIRPDLTEPVVALTGLKINNQPVDLQGTPTKFPHLFNTLTDLSLTYDQNYLTVDFAALRYHQPDRATYRYQLAGYDDQWIHSDQPTAGYTKLPPGNYRLRVNAANSMGQWSEQIRSLAIRVSPPIWASGWAYGLYGLSGILLLAGLARFRLRREREQREIALREQQASDLRQLDQAKTRFFANVSHELRTPLTLMLGPLSTVLVNQQLTPRDEQLVQMAQRNTQQLLSLVNELLDLTKLEAGKMDLQPQPVQLKSLINGLVAGFDSYAQQRGITLTGDLTVSDNPVINLDERKFRLVLTNLLANALKFTPANGVVRVVVNYEMGQLRVSVSDTGRGISPEDLPHIFDRYFQTKQLNAATEGGTGIGLALCRELIRLMQGRLWADSQLGLGSTFTLLIPAAESQAGVVDEVDSPIGVPVGNSTSERLFHTPSDLVPAPSAQPDARQETVLVVEDNPDLRAYLTTILSASLVVKTAANGQEALNILAGMAQLPALVISDVMMPVMDGFQLVESLKVHDTFWRIPVILLTARAELADKLRALRIGVDDYLLKPFDQDELTARIAALLHNQRERATTPGVPDDTAATGLPLTETAYSQEEMNWLKRLEERTYTRLADFALTTDELADELAMSRSTFYRTIKRLTGLTPIQYLTEARFRQARLLLETRRVSTVKQAAHQVGFRQVNHFAQTYTQRFGKAPIDYL